MTGITFTWQHVVAFLGTVVGIIIAVIKLKGGKRLDDCTDDFRDLYKSEKENSDKILVLEQQLKAMGKEIIASNEQTQQNFKKNAEYFSNIFDALNSLKIEIVKLQSVKG